jgi:hypothetical protein
MGLLCGWNPLTNLAGDRIGNIRCNAGRVRSGWIEILGPF